MLALAGMQDELRAELDRAPLRPLHDNWYLTTEAAVRSLVAGFTGDEDLARRSVDVLRPLSGRMAVSGISVVIGPVDGYVAIALATLGERAEAATFAARAEALATHWGMTAYLRWFAAERTRLGF